MLRPSYPPSYIRCRRDSLSVACATPGQKWPKVCRELVGKRILRVTPRREDRGVASIAVPAFSAGGATKIIGIEIHHFAPQPGVALEELAPKDNLDGKLDLSFERSFIQNCYASWGCPSADVSATDALLAAGEEYLQEDNAQKKSKD